MSQQNKQMNNLINNYSNLLQFYFRNGRKTLDFNDKPYAVFIDSMYKYMSPIKYFDIDIFLDFWHRHFEELVDFPEDINIENVQDLINDVIETLEINADCHFIIVPLPKAKLSKVIHFDRFTFIPRLYNEENKIDEIQKITNIEPYEIENMLNHIKRSRSRDFMKHSLLVISMTDQTSFIHTNANHIAKYCIYLIRILYFANKHRSKQSIFESMQSFYTYEPNTHLAVIAKDLWRCSGIGIDFITECNFDLDFISEHKNQVLLKELATSFIFKNSKDEFLMSFLNSIILFNKAYDQKLNKEESLATLLLITAGESLLTEGKNEKRLRLSALLSRLISIDHYESYQVAEIINSIYKMRNDFVHAGKEVDFLNVFETDNNTNHYFILRQTIAKLLINFNHFDSLLSEDDKDTNKQKKWQKYLDNLFDNVITGKPTDSTF
ncbi:hypothetical protein [Bacillus cereus]|uniref:hypothetical protein n=2 Tax=Bacillus cereus group TaxID=86661 RepID=UPI003D178C32